MGYFIDRQDGTFEIEYGGKACPFTGIDSSAPPPYIAPNALIDSNNFIIVDNSLNTTQLQLSTSYNDSGTNLTENYTLCVFTLSNRYQTGSITYTLKGGGSSLYVYNGSTLVSSIPVVASSPKPNTITYRVVNQILYFSYLYVPAIYQFDGTSLSVLTNYLGVAYLSELNGRLIGAYPTYATGITYTNQIVWCGPQGAYSTWNPLDSNSLVTGAGFNTLTDVSDVITGIFTIGVTAYIIRTQGITEMTPLNNGVNPFDFNHLWSSQRGIGSVFPLSVQQYGSVGVFISETDIFMIGYDGIQTITGISKTLIYSFIADAVNATQLGSTVDIGPSTYLGPLTINNSSDLYYVLTYYDSTKPDPQVLKFLALNTVTKAAIRFDCNLDISTSTKINNIILSSISSFSQSQFLASGLIVSIEQITPNPIVEPVTYYTSTYLLPNSPIAATNAYLVFPVEEIKVYRDITIDGFIVYAYSLSGGSVLSLSMGGTGGTLTTTGNGWSYYRIFPDITTPVSTGISPQLTITVTENPNLDQLIIGKIVVFGSYDNKQRPL